jgi:type II secretory pathway pseudopilin PulG
MKQPRFLLNSSSRGFSLVEAVITSAVLVLVTAAIFGLLSQSQSSYRSQQYILQVTQQARTAVDQVCTYLRQAGNDPEEYLKNNNIPPIEILGSNHIRINSDISGSVPATSGDPLEATGDPDGNLDNLYERVEIRYDPTEKNLYLDIGNGADVLAENLSFNLTFFDGNGNETNVQEKIARVRVEVVAETKNADPQTAKVQSMTLQSEVMLRSQSFDVFAN